MMRRIANVAALGLVLAACTQQNDANDGIASAGGAQASSTNAATGVRDGVKLAKCLRDQGIPAQDPAGAEGKPVIPESVSGERVDAAYEKCREFAPDYGKPIPAPDPAQLEKLRKFAACMREQGVDWPDPDPRTGRPAGTPGTGDRDPGRAGANGGPDIVAAAKICAEKVPGTGISVESPDGPKGTDPTR